MRSWIMQPGTLLTHWENVGQAAFTLLGLIALSAAVIATFYTTASDALGESQDFGFVSYLGRMNGAGWPTYFSSVVPFDYGNRWAEVGLDSQRIIVHRLRLPWVDDPDRS